MIKIGGKIIKAQPGYSTIQELRISSIVVLILNSNHASLY